jgi:hypothetical protein
MTNKSYNWHKAWQRLPNGRLRHDSGLECAIAYWPDYVYVNIVDETIAECFDGERARSVPAHDLYKRLTRLEKEAAMWHCKNPI